MSKLITEPNIASPDDVYARLIAAHEGLTDAQSRKLDAALILTLANHVGDQHVLEQAIESACRAALTPAEREPE